MHKTKFSWSRSSGLEKIIIYIFTSVVLLIAALIAIFSLIGSVDITGLSIALLLAVGSLIIFVTTRARSRQEHATHNSSDFNSRIFFSARSDAKNISLALGMVCYLLAILNIVGAITPSTTGRWAWLWSYIVDWLGPYGYAFFLLSIGTSLIIISVTKK